MSLAFKKQFAKGWARVDSQQRCAQCPPCRYRGADVCPARGNSAGPPGVNKQLYCVVDYKPASYERDESGSLKD